MRQYLDLNGNLVHHFEIHLRTLEADHRKSFDHSYPKRVDFDNFPYGVSLQSLREVEE